MLLFLFVFYFLCKALPGAETIGKRAASCNWECRVLRSFDFVPKMKAGIGMHRILSLDLTLKKSADDNCLNQTDSKLADGWMWSTVNTLTHERNVFSDGSPVLFRKSVEGRIEGTVACTLNLSKDPTIHQLHLSINDLIAKVLMEEFEESANVWQTSGAVLCYKVTEQNSLYVCLNTTFDNSISAAPPNKTVEWPVRALSGFIVFIWIMSMLFSPVVFCLFTPTHKCSVEKCLIVLKGPSHISIRGWLANFVSIQASKLPSINSSACRKLFLVLAVTLCATYVLAYNVLFYLVDLSAYLHILGIDDYAFYSYETMLVPSSLWAIRGLLRVFCSRLSLVKPCFACAYFKGEITSHRVPEPAKEIKKHLRIQPLIISKCLSLFCNYFKRYFCRRKLRCNWIALCQFVCLVLLIPIALPVSLVACLVSILISVFYICPMSTFFDIYVRPFIPMMNSGYKKVFGITILATGLIFPYAGWFSLNHLIFASLFIKVFTIVLRQDNIPYLLLLVLCTSYCSSCYYSFTRKYDDLAAKLYSHLKIRVQQGDETDIKHALYLEHNKKRAIPKYIFDKACRELMPLGENVCKSLFYIFLVLSFFVLVFTIVMETPGVPDRMKITTAFLVAAIPKLVEIVVLKKGDKMEELEEQELDEKIQSIVDDYYNNPVDGKCPNQIRLREERQQEEWNVGTPTIIVPSGHIYNDNDDDNNDDNNIF